MQNAIENSFYFLFGALDCASNLKFLLHFQKVSVQSPRLTMARNKLSFNPAIAHPCQESWAGMIGSPRERHCQSCGKQVHNFAALTSREIERLAQEKEGGLCARITHRADGSLVTLDAIPRPSYAAQIAVSASLVIGAAGAMAQSSMALPQESRAVLTGTLLKPDGSGPVSGALIFVRSSGSGNAFTTSDVQGWFST